MDRRLIEAAQRGNVDNLRHLLKEDPLMLHAVALSSGETPLHIASMAGHTDFVKEVIGLKPEMAGELNQDGFSPLHLASANGYLEIVKEILKSNPGFCRIKSRDRMTALHCAAMKGRVGVIQELLSVTAGAIEDATIRGETTLHLAVKNHQFEAFCTMVEWLKRCNKLELLNRKDEQGNTILHLATSTKQREVVEILLREGASTAGMLEVNAINKIGLTALDVLLLFPSEAGDREIEEILRNAEALRSQEHPIPMPTNPLHGLGNRRTTKVLRRYRFRESLKFNYKLVKTRDPKSEQRNALMVIAVLIATTTHQAALSPPGSVWQDTDYVNDTTNTVRIHYAGKSILGSTDPLRFGAFVFFNTAGFCVSIFIILALTYGFPLILELKICMMAMTGTYFVSITTITPSGSLTYFFYTISILMPIMMLIPWIFKSRKRSLEANRLAIAKHGSV